LYLFPLSLAGADFFSVHTHAEDYLDLRGLDRGRLDGSMAFADREEQMRKFKERPECMIFLLSTRAGGLGINLTAADTVIIYDSDWVRNFSQNYPVVQNSKLN